MVAIRTAQLEGDTSNLSAEAIKAVLTGLVEYDNFATLHVFNTL